MIENIEQLIEQANQIESESDRVKFIMNYFLTNVQYDYAYLLAGGYMKETISAIKEGNIFASNPFKKGKIIKSINGKPQECNDSYCLTTEISTGESKLLNKIVELSERSKGNKDYFFQKLQELLSSELETHIDNREIVSSNVSSLISKIKKDMEMWAISKVDNEYYFITQDIKRVLLSYLLEPDKHFPSKIENGILKTGVCAHFADYLQELLPKIGIDAVKVGGTSELHHVWIAAIIDNELKSIDLTRAIFIRDGFKNIPSDQKSSDWLIADFADTFKMQKTRTIMYVGTPEEELPEIIDGNNYNAEFLKKIVIEQCCKKSGIKKF